MTEADDLKRCVPCYLVGQLMQRFKPLQRFELSRSSGDSEGCLGWLDHWIQDQRALKE